MSDTGTAGQYAIAVPAAVWGPWRRSSGSGAPSHFLAIFPTTQKADRAWTLYCLGWWGRCLLTALLIPAYLLSIFVIPDMKPVYVVIAFAGLFGIFSFFYKAYQFCSRQSLPAVLSREPQIGDLYDGITIAHAVRTPTQKDVMAVLAGIAVVLLAVLVGVSVMMMV
jgi:hypothetical protein